MKLIDKLKYFWCMITDHEYITINEKVIKGVEFLPNLFIKDTFRTRVCIRCNHIWDEYHEYLDEQVQKTTKMAKAKQIWEEQNAKSSS